MKMVRAAQTTAYASAVVATFCGVTPVIAGDVDVVVQRTDRAIEVYFAMPANTLVTAFGLDPAHLARPDGTVPFDELRLGTWDIGDAALEDVETMVGGAPAVFEAMSLMAHPANAALPMMTPLEAMISIEVCSIPTPEVPLTLDDLRVYVGYIAYVDDPTARLTFELPSDINQDLSVDIRDFTAHAPNAAYVDTASRGDPISIAAVSEPVQASIASGAGAAWLSITSAAIFGGGWAVLRRRQRRLGR
ncbi:MAG: hypothetical protein HRU32_15820 [Rhodobacteraceae bacterium]|nr:hypothetical protein [Paracoccaceae bacterium]